MIKYNIIIKMHTTKVVIYNSDNLKQGLELFVLDIYDNINGLQIGIYDDKRQSQIWIALWNQLIECDNDISTWKVTTQLGNVININGKYGIFINLELKFIAILFINVNK